MNLRSTAGLGWRTRLFEVIVLKRLFALKGLFLVVFRNISYVFLMFLKGFYSDVDLLIIFFT